MWGVFTIDILVNVISLVTNTFLFRATLKEKNLNLRAKCLILMFVLCDLSTSISYLSIVYQKIRLGIMLVYRDTARGLGLINWTLFYHETSFFLFAMNVFVLSAERLLHGKYNKFIETNEAFCNGITCLVVFLSVACSCCASYFQHIRQIRVPPALTMTILQITGVVVLALTITINRFNYYVGTGEHLELRYQCSQTYRYNKALLKYLFGSVCFRSIAFGCICYLILTEPPDETFGWLSFFYHNINAFSNSIFPWLVILYNEKKSRLFCFIRNTTSPEIIQVSDLTGKPLDMTANGERYFEQLKKAW